MGLLDALFGQPTAQSSGGGLLDFLRNNAINQQMAPILQSDQAQYGLPMQAFAQAAPTPAVMPSRVPAPQPQPAAPVQPTEPIPQPLAQSQPVPQTPAAFGGGFSIGRLFNPDGLVARLTGNDSQSIKQQAAAAQAGVTANFLRSHGVPDIDIAAAVGNGRAPGNGEILKVLMANNVKEKNDYRPATAAERKAANIPEGQPLFIEANTNKPIFGPSSTNVNVSTEKTGQAELAKTGVESYVAAQTAGRDAQKRVAMYDQFEKAAQGFTPGATAETRLAAKRYLKDAGLIKGEDVPDGEVMQMISRQLGVHAQPKGQGAVSNYERELFAKSLPNMTQSPEGLKMAIDISRKLEQHDQKVAEIYRESARANNGLPNYLQVQEKIAALGSPLSDSHMAALSGGSPTPAAAPQAASAGGSGWTSIGNGVKIRPK